MSTDRDLLCKYLKAKDMKAFDAIVDRHQADLLRLASAFLGDLDESQDAVQEVFIRLSDCSGGIDRQPVMDGSLGPWLRRVLRNECIDRLRRSTTRKERPLVAEMEPMPNDDDTGPKQTDSADLIWQALESLTGLQRAAVLLRYRDGASYQEIAERLDKTVNHIGVLLHQALARLRESPALRAEVLS